MTTPRPRLASSLLLAMLVFAAGCDGGKTTAVVPPADGLPAGTPINNSSANLMIRLNATFDAQVASEYAKLLTDDFRFHFSQAADPDLVAFYGDNWLRNDETLAVSHLFGGFTNAMGEVIPGATTVDMALTGIQTQDDAGHPDSLAHYRKIVVTTMNLVAELPTSPDPTTYNTSSRNEFWVVRGDAAVLASGQASDSTRWYLRRWDDLATAVAARKGPVVNPASTRTIGKIKALYR